MNNCYFSTQLEIVDELNAEHFYENEEDIHPSKIFSPFSFIYTGSYWCITFLDELVYDDEDCRIDINDELSDQEIKDEIKIFISNQVKEILRQYNYFQKKNTHGKNL